MLASSDPKAAEVKEMIREQVCVLILMVVLRHEPNYLKYPVVTG